MSVYDLDLFVIGAGSGGIRAARALRSRSHANSGAHALIWVVFLRNSWSMGPAIATT